MNVNYVRFIFAIFIICLFMKNLHALRALTSQRMETHHVSCDRITVRFVHMLDVCVCEPYFRWSLEKVWFNRIRKSETRPKHWRWQLWRQQQRWRCGKTLWKKKKKEIQFNYTARAGSTWITYTMCIAHTVQSNKLPFTEYMLFKVTNFLRSNIRFDWFFN